MDCGVFCGTTIVYWSGAPVVIESCSCSGLGCRSYAVSLYFLPPTMDPFVETTSSAPASYRHSRFSEIECNGYGTGTNWERNVRVTSISIEFCWAFDRSPV